MFELGQTSILYWNIFLSIHFNLHWSLTVQEQYLENSLTSSERGSSCDGGSCLSVYHTAINFLPIDNLSKRINFEFSMMILCSRDHKGSHLFMKILTRNQLHNTSMVPQQYWLGIVCMV